MGSVRGRKPRVLETRKGGREVSLGRVSSRTRTGYWTAVAGMLDGDDILIDRKGQGLETRCKIVQDSEQNRLVQMGF